MVSTNRNLITKEMRQKRQAHEKSRRLVESQVDHQEEKQEQEKKEHEVKVPKARDSKDPKVAQPTQPVQTQPDQEKSDDSLTEFANEVLESQEAPAAGDAPATTPSKPVVKSSRRSTSRTASKKATTPKKTATKKTVKEEV